MEAVESSNATNGQKDLAQQEILKIKQETADNAGTSRGRQSGSNTATNPGGGNKAAAEGGRRNLVRSINRTLSEAAAVNAGQGTPISGSASRESQPVPPVPQAFDEFVQPFALPPPSPGPSPLPTAPRKSSQADPIALVAPTSAPAKPHVFPRESLPPSASASTHSLPTTSTSAFTSSAPLSTFGRSSSQLPDRRFTSMVPFPSSKLESNPVPPNRTSASPRPFPSRRSTSEDSQGSQLGSTSIAAMLNGASRDGSEGIERTRLGSFPEESCFRRGTAGSDSEDSDEIVLVSTTTQLSPPKKRQRLSSSPPTRSKYSASPPSAQSRPSPPRSLSVEMEVDRSRESSDSSELSTVDTIERKSSESTAADEDGDEIMSDGFEEASEVKKGKRRANSIERGGNPPPITVRHRAEAGSASSESEEETLQQVVRDNPNAREAASRPASRSRSPATISARKKKSEKKTGQSHADLLLLKALNLPPEWFMQITQCSTAVTSAKKKTIEANLISNPISRKPCKPCRTRRTGYACTFRNFRAFRKLEDGTFDLNPRFFHTPQDTIPDFPSGLDFNVPFSEWQASLLKTVAAEKLAPTMRKEYEHASQEGVVRFSRELGTINNCDTCLHVILCGSWLCGSCGDEICFDCHSVLEGIERKTEGETVSEVDNLSRTTLKKLSTCQPKQDHGLSDFVPLTRMDVSELERTVKDMEDWKENHSMQPPKQLSQEWIDQYSHQPEQFENSHPYLRLPSTLLPNSRTQFDAAPSPSSTAVQDSFLDELDDFDSAPSPPLLPDNMDPFELFQSIWARGEALVVDLSIAQQSELPWDPAFFIERFGDERVTIASNIPGCADRTSTVGEFFEKFGKKGEFTKSEKIKDWPPSTDFRHTFPALWKDFMSILPVGSVTRRDGVLNISTHTPKNANPPDLGPKGYFSEISDDQEDGQGSTKLHTVNVLLWSSYGPQNERGIAVWDLYRAEDADKIRDFLYERIADLYEGGNVSKARMNHDDPIHTQRFFLDRKLRKELWEKKGVKSWRIHQHPGQVVFIPAGCAHQVCNYSDCIKIASDFVSIENVGRCWKVTDEFRQQTKEEKLWRSDVLGLKSQLLWAWKSAERFDQKE